MKFVLVDIRRGGPGEHMMVYPQRYNAQDVDRMGRGPAAIGASPAYSGEIGRGGEREQCLIYVNDALARAYDQDPEMRIVDVATAETLLEQWRVANGLPEETVTDSNRIQAIRAKQEAGLALSAEDLQALDPEQPTPGITRTRLPLATLFGSDVGADDAP